MTRLPHTAILISLPLLYLPVVVANSTTISLKQKSDDLPYRLVVYPNPFEILLADFGWTSGGFFHDLDGDGDDEAFVAGNPEIKYQRMDPEIGLQHIWWQNVAPEFSFRDPCASLDGLWDVSGHGQMELVCTMHTQDGFTWRIQRRLAATGAIIATYDLSGGDDEWVNGVWDGAYKVIGCLDVHLQSATLRGLVVGAMAGLDRQPRGVLVVDIETGQTIWTYFVGPKPDIDSFRICDLDDDGREEICFTGAAVNNIHDRKFNGTFDDRPMAFVLHDDGRLAWSYSYETGTGRLKLGIGDGDGDGLQEVYLGGALTNSGANLLVVLNHQGAEIARTAVGAGIRDLVVTLSSQEQTQIHLSQKNGRLQRFISDGRSLTPAAKIETGDPYTRILAEADLVERPGKELLLRVGSDNLWLVDESLEPLAYIPDLQFGTVNRALIRHSANHPAIVVLPGEAPVPAQSFLPVDSRSHGPISAILAVFAIGLASTGTFVLYRRRDSRRNTRDLRLQLLTQLRIADHGRIGPLSALRNLIWLNQTYNTGFTTPNRSPDEIIAQSVHECTNESLPRLREIIALARQATDRRDLVDRAEGSITHLKDLLDQLDSADHPSIAIRDLSADFHRHCDVLKRVTERIRQEIAGSFRADPNAIFERSLIAHRKAIEEKKVTVVQPDRRIPECRVDRQEMAFVLDNLLDNALCAMTGEGPHRLTIDWKEAGGEIEIEVTDTGCGPPPEGWDEVMNRTRQTTDGRGLGLPGSREILQKYDAHLAVRRSMPGEGTTIAVTSHRATDDPVTKRS